MYVLQALERHKIVNRVCPLVAAPYTTSHRVTCCAHHNGTFSLAWWISLQRPDLEHASVDFASNDEVVVPVLREEQSDAAEGLALLPDTYCAVSRKMN
jgi:hypothetical protein